jgi:glucan biosynthesis protein C
MLLGIVFHSALAYDTVWPWFKDAPTTHSLTYVVLGLHAFRMPLFFILAGFFASLLLSRRSPGGFVINRSVRVGIPFAVGWLVLVPFVIAGFTFANAVEYFHYYNFAWFLTRQAAAQGQFFFEDVTAHLWFLYYLLLFYVVFLVASPLASLIPGATRSRASGAFAALLVSPLAVPVLAGVAYSVQLLQPFLKDDTPLEFGLDLSFLLFYGFFFLFGVLLFPVRHVLGEFQRGAWLNLAVGVGALVVFLFAADRWLDGDSLDLWQAVGRLANSILIWALFLGLVGLLLGLLEKPSPAVRYVSDASYWCYLLHLPLVIWGSGLLAGRSWAPMYKFGVLVSVVTVICFVTYDLLVRWTFLGAVLNGRRYPSVSGRLVRALLARARPVTAPA